MRVGVSAHRLVGQRLGIGRYMEYLFKYWNQMVSSPDRVTLYVSEPLTRNGLHLSDAFEFRVVSPKMSGILWENLLLSHQARGQDVLFGPSYTLPLAYPGRCVVATHSINEVQGGTHPWWYSWTYAPAYRLSAQKADKVIVPSESVKRDVQEHYRIPAGKIAIVPEGVDEAFHPIADEELLRTTRRRYLGADRPYILYVGKFSQRRNIPLLIRAFAAVKKRERIPHCLLLNGPNITAVPVEEMGRELGIADSLVHVNEEVSDHRQIVPLYAAADLYVFPSAYEGFSLTTVEALACGVPVVAANRAAVAEIVGDAGVLVDELTVDAFADAIARVVGDGELQRDLRARGPARARLFRWEETARRTLEVLRQVAEA